MPQFVHVGEHYINLKRVVRFHVIPDRHGDGVQAIDIWLTHPKHVSIRITSPGEIKHLLGWLRDNMPNPGSKVVPLADHFRTIRLDIPPAKID